MTATVNHWVSIHVFLAATPLMEDYLCHHAIPCIRRWRSEGWVRDWFFVRYWEGGPHLRLRLLCPENRAADDFVPDLADGLVTRMSGSGLRKADYYANHTFDGQAQDPALLPWFDEGSVEIITYEPEIQRYGGPVAMRSSERLFHRSSELAAGVIRQTRSAFEKRLAVACSLMAATAVSLTCDIEVIERFLAQYAAFWASYSAQNRQIAAQLKSDADASQVAILEGLLHDKARLSQPDALISVWHEGVTELASDLERAYSRGELRSPFDATQVRAPETHRAVSQHIMCSQLHMLNNRLGVVPAQELVLASALSAAAGAVRRRAGTRIKEIAT